MAPKKIWSLQSWEPERQKLLTEPLGISPWIAQILIHRGIKDPVEAGIFLRPDLKNLPDPFFLPDMKPAVDRILQAIGQREKIAVFGDYDVDGITSTAILRRFFSDLGIAITAHIPDRLRDGYGLQEKILRSWKEEGVGLAITADCGSKSVSELAVAKSIGLDVIVTDHHEMDRQLPPAFALINPQRLEEKRGKELAGCGVVFFLLMAVRQKLREANLFPGKEPNLKRLLDLVALGTVADMAPITGINRILVSFGLKELAQTDKVGLLALKEICGLKTGESITQYDIGFKLAPRLNAGGRIAKAGLGLDLLCESDLSRARKLAQILEQCNEDRRQLQEKQVAEALEQTAGKEQQRSCVVFSENFHPGIVGLVASKLTEQFYRPSIAFCPEGAFARGSARSIPGIHIVEVLEKLSHHLEHFGGHAMAAGMTIKKENLEIFSTEFENILLNLKPIEAFVPQLHLDGEIRLAEMTPELLTELELLRPFGIGNPEPVLLCKNLALKNPRVVGGSHLRCLLSDGELERAGIGFSLAQSVNTTAKDWDIAGIPEWNTFNGTKTLQMKIKDLRISS